MTSQGWTDNKSDFVSNMDENNVYMDRYPGSGSFASTKNRFGACPVINVQVINLIVSWSHIKTFFLYQVI